MKAIRRSITALAAGSALILAGCGTSTSSKSEDGMDEVTVQLDYQVRGNHAMFFVAKEKGFFEEENIDVTDINTGSGSPDALRFVGEDNAQFGFADLPSLVTARSQNVPVKAISAVNQTSPLGLCALKDNLQINELSDIEGKKMGVHPAGSTYIFYKALLASNGIGKEDVTEVTVTPPYENYLLQNQVDAVVCYIDAEVPLLEEKAGGEGSLSIFMGSDAGYEAYGSGLFTTDKLIENDPELVQRFTDAYIKAFEWVDENPEEAASLLSESSPELKDKTDLFAKQLKADVESTFTSDETEAEGLGSMNEEMWKSTIDILADQDELDSVPSAEDVYTNQFVEKANSTN